MLSDSLLHSFSQVAFEEPFNCLREGGREGGRGEERERGTRAYDGQ